MAFCQLQTPTDYCKHSFFPLAIVQWNTLHEIAVCSLDVESFQAAISGLQHSRTWSHSCCFNPSPAEHMPCLSKQCRSRSVGFWRSQTDLDLHCLPSSMWIYINNLDQVIWLAENYKWVWHLNLFSMTRVNLNLAHLLDFLLIIISTRQRTCWECPYRCEAVCEDSVTLNKLSIPF